MFYRSLRLPKAGQETFFLWGPRQTGKTTLLKAAHPEALWIDLLKADEYRRYLQNPEFLRAEAEARRSLRRIVVDEVQIDQRLVRNALLARGLPEPDGNQFPGLFDNRRLLIRVRENSSGPQLRL